MSSLQIRESQRWRETQLTYDGALWSYSKYTHAVIRKGHSLVVQLCEQIARDLGYRPTILDIGCGWTDLYEKLHHVIDTYIGVEPAAGQLMRAESRPNQFLIRGVGEKIVLRDSCVDIVLHIADLDHCFDADKAISETFRVLKPGGRTIILLENKGRFSNDIRKFFNVEISHGEEHLYYFSLNDLLSLVSPYGKVDYVRSYGFLLGFDWISNLMPESFVSWLEALVDRMLGQIFVRKGQHFLATVVKEGSSQALPLGFTCPYCRESFDWKARHCTACKHELRWMRSDILDAIDHETGSWLPV